jgi:DNA invertase Pin-like site-specific DNA recombinase
LRATVVALMLLGGKALGVVLVDGFSRATSSASCRSSGPRRGERASGLHRDVGGNSVRTIIVESPDHIACDLAVQLAGHGFLRNLGVARVPATAPDFFLEDTRTAVLVRQVLGAIAQFEKASLVAKLKVPRDRKIAQGIKCGGRKSYAEKSLDLVAAAKVLRPSDRG